MSVCMDLYHCKREAISITSDRAGRVKLRLQSPVNFMMSSRCPIGRWGICCLSYQNLVLILCDYSLLSTDSFILEWNCLFCVSSCQNYINFYVNNCHLKDYLESPCRLLLLYFQIVGNDKELYKTFAILSFALRDKNENSETRQNI